MQSGRANSIFTSQEVLISCSSLRTLDVKAFIDQKKEQRINVTSDFINHLLVSIKKDVVKKADLLVSLIKKRASRATTAELICAILLNRRYRRGKREDNNPAMIYQKITKRIKEKRPIQLTISLFPCKIPNRLKAAGNLPDLAEVASLARLAEIAIAVSSIYKFGLEVIVLTDGKRFQDVLDFDSEILMHYRKQLNRIVEVLGLEKHIKLIEYVQFLNEHLPLEKLDEKNINIMN